MLNLNGNGHHRRRNRAQIEKDFEELFSDAPVYPHHSAISDKAAEGRIVAQLRQYGPASFRVLKLTVCNQFFDEATLARSISRLVMVGVLSQDGAYPVKYVLQQQ